MCTTSKLVFSCQVETCLSYLLTCFGHVETRDPPQRLKNFSRDTLTNITGVQDLACALSLLLKKQAIP